jgi:AraC-like DNA-binding protein
VRVRRLPHDWLDELRILAAQQRLLSGEQEKNVVSALGFKLESQFCRQFKSHTGMTPTEFLAASPPAARDVANR